MVDVDKMNELGLQSYQKQLDYIENQYLNLIYNRLLDVIQERWEYEKTINLIEWKCAICGEKILADKKRNDVENFVCNRCKEYHNNKNEIIDHRILDSRTKMYKTIEDRLYEELEDNLTSIMQRRGL